MRYRRLFCERAILQQMMGVAASDLYEINVLQIMGLAQEAWDEVDRTTIQNCWRRAGILSLPRNANGEVWEGSPDTIIPYEPEPPLMDDDEGIQNAMSDLRDALDQLELNGALAPLDALTAEELVNVPEEQTGGERWSDDEIVEQVRAEMQEEDGVIQMADEDDDEPECPVWSD
ncbi:hypothetical protein CALVIDRAFT_561208 [Calocera viscosa TUFC12733]|uniref:DDE-1 domain-containing protein n=1 Tax=Calocera viscosa (strain TUFC12733) TaxID=1330018 RepID=A0A167Q270_CALVF|nr:hypothetical protein CALVIDRAFT_561208 [Calocera viscosa TUFC12733]